MPLGIGAAGVVGIGFEALATPNTYVTPIKFIPIENESLKYNPTDVERRPLQASADIINIKLGHGSVEGDIKFAVYHDVLAYFLYASRAIVTKAGAGPYTYTAVGSHGATASYTLSITVERNGVVYAYTGCVVGKTSYALENGILMCTASIVGQGQSTQASPVEAYTSTDNEFSAGQYAIEYDDVVVTDVDEFTINIDDAAQPLHRVTNTRDASAIAFGARTVEISLSRDFENKAEYNLFLAGTAQKLEFIATNGTNVLTFLSPVTKISTHEVPLSGATDLVRASINYKSVHDAVLSSAYSLEITTDEDITVPV